MPDRFHDLSLRPELLEALDQLGYHTMTPIQAAALPAVLAGADVLGQAMTGSGKTAAFGLGLLERFDADRMVVQGLVLCPTRELADQVANELRRLAQRTPNTRIVTLCGGRSPRDQRLALEQGVQFVVGTPGRVADHLRTERLDLTDLQCVVLDEADRMLDMGFIDEVQEILANCPRRRQTLLFSATFSEDIHVLSEQIQNEPVRIEVEATVQADVLRQWVFECDRRERLPMLGRLLATHRPEAALIFCETRADCEEARDFLAGRGVTALALHGGLEQQERDDVLVQFANGSTRLLVATNVAARGLDIPSLPAVIVTELSNDPESHLHRIGRTGRAGESGLALSIVCGTHEQQRLAAIEAYLGHPLERGPSPTDGPLDFLEPPYRTVLVLSGRKHKLRKGDLLGALVKDGGLPADAIGSIDLSDKTCAVAIARPLAARALKFLQSARVKNQRVRAVLLGELMGKPSMTLALRALDAAKVAYVAHPYPYVARGGTRASSVALGVSEHVVIKTIVLRADRKQPLVVLMHGDRQVSTKELARVLGVKDVEPCAPDEAQRHTGYQVGGTSPFGLRKRMPIYVESTVLDLPTVYVNGGRRGLLVELAPQVFVDVLQAQPVRVARP